MGHRRTGARPLHHRHRGTGRHHGHRVPEPLQLAHRHGAGLLRQGRRGRRDRAGRTLLAGAAQSDADPLRGRLRGLPAVRADHLDRHPDRHDLKPTPWTRPATSRSRSKRRQVADYQKNLFLRYAAPAEYGRLQTEFGARSDFIRRNNASTQFSAQAILPNEAAMQVALSGVLMTWVGDKKAAEKQTTWLVGFRYLNGRLHVSEFRETSDQDPFGAGVAAR
ncbi:MAG TPA: hypothetical protein DGC76_00105 [Candidatus Accumulibacter sp.]|nr:hypothetical protein [Accumulibacter sp.]